MRGNNYRKERDKDGQQTSSWMVARSMRDLTARSISVAATPNQMAAAGPNPYPMIAAQNRIIDTNYAGYDNLAGNIPVEIANNPNSKYLLSYDNAVIRLSLRYNYMAISPDDKNVAVNNEYIKAMNEALSNAFAETFTDLPFFDYIIKTDMPGCNTDTNLATADQRNILAFATFYQTILQNIAMIGSKYKQMLAMETFLYDQSWQRETPQLKQLFGLLKKKTLQATVEAILNYLPGAALDTSWLTQTNILCNVPCKRSDSYDDPLICVNPVTAIPNISVFVGGTEEKHKVFAYNNGKVGSDYSANVGGSNVTIEELAAKIIEAMSPYSIAAWARQAYEGTSTITAREYFNTLLDMLEAMVTIMARFPSDMADFDVVLKVMNRVGLNNWQFGAAINTDIGVQYKPVFNRLLYDLIAANCAGGSSMTFDNNTRRWKFYTLWDRVEDIPDYDRKSGGAFLAFSLRSLPNDTDYTTTKWLIPILFKLESDVEIMNRKGFTTGLEYTNHNYNQMIASPVLSRLCPLPSMNDAQLRVPTINVSKDSDTTIANASMAIKFVMKLCGVGTVAYGDGLSETSLSDTTMNLIDEQMEDVSNAMINQARVSSPFRTAVAKDVRTIGFVKVI